MIDSIRDNMRDNTKTWLTCMIAVTLAGTACAADAPILRADHKVEVERELVKVEHTWNEAFKDRDKAGLSAICGEDFLFTGEDRKLADRTKFIAEATTHLKVMSYAVSDVTARFYGDTGILNALWKGTVIEDDHRSEVTVRFTDTFVRRDGRWWAVASQMSRAAEAGAAN